MTARVASATGRPTIVFLHFLGGSADSWKPVEDILAFRFRCRRFDLPGFGGSPHREGQAVAEMADRVVAAMGGTAPTRWIVAGHSMGAKVALLLARRAENGDERLSGLRGVVSVAGSPPGPEPMEDDKRAEMLRWFAGDEASSRREADGYVRNNVGAELPRERHEAAVADVLRAERHAWRRWLTHGSREDLRGEVGELAVPALVIAGGADEALGEDAQREHTLPHLRHHELAVLPGLGHLLPIEAPEEVAERIARFAVRVADDGMVPVPDPARMTERTVALLRSREQAGDPERAPAVFSAAELRCLRAACERILPHDIPKLDVALLVDAALEEGTGDGWRFENLPPDREAYRLGLQTLDERARAAGAVDFAGAGGEEQERILRDAAEGAEGPGRLDPHALGCWFQELRGDAARHFMSHPAVMRRIGCDASATGTDDELFGFEGVRSVSPTGVVR